MSERAHSTSLRAASARSRHSCRMLLALMLLSHGLVIGFFLAFPLEPGFDWRSANAHLLLATGVMAVAAFVHACITLSLREATLLFLLTAFVTTAAEWSGVHFGVPFGSRYEYNIHLTPRIAGTIPVFIPIAWFVLIYAPLVVLRPLFARSGSPGRRRLFAHALVCAVLLASMDLYLDPLAVHVGAWQWHRTGAWFGVPASNFLGWILVGLVVYASFLALGGLRAPRWVARIRFLDRVFVLAALPLVLAALTLVAYHLQAWWSIVIVMAILITALVWWQNALNTLPVADERAS